MFIRMKRKRPLSKFTDAEFRNPANRVAVMTRGRYIRRMRSGLAVNAPLPGFELEDAIEEIRHLEIDRKAGRLTPRVRPSTSAAALRVRLHRLRRLAPSGVTADVWREIVDHFQGRCATEGCPALACGVSRIPDGTPVPACRVHKVGA